jgi:2-hydroxy-3-keto-5-methylthiopentenyl-1-phosphate phosphatase
MSKVKPEIQKFLEKSNKVLIGDRDPAEEFIEIIKRETMRQAKDQLASGLAPVLSRLESIERQQNIIIGMLKKKLDLDPYEKEIMDLLKQKLTET